MHRSARNSQSTITRAALSTGGRAKSNFLSVDTMRSAFESVKNDPGASTNGIGPSVFPGLPVITGPEDDFNEWMDFSLLPPFEKVAQYFSFTVYTGSANVDGLTLKLFAPTPPALRSNASPKPGNQGAKKPLLCFSTPLEAELCTFRRGHNRMETQRRQAARFPRPPGSA